MGKKSKIVRPRLCLICEQLVETSSKGLKKHAKSCAGKS